MCLASVLPEGPIVRVKILGGQWISIYLTKRNHEFRGKGEMDDDGVPAALLGALDIR